MPEKQFGFPSFASVSALLTKTLPGTSERALRLRADILDFCCDLSAKTVFLSGPIGAGKSTVARTISYLKRVLPLKAAEASRVIDDVRYDGPGRIDAKLMSWFVEMPLTGLTDSLAESQLFGMAIGAATDVRERPGVFEMASTGRASNDSSAGAKVTGGVVFLDEIGDLSPALQSKLLPVLSNGVFYRVGGEGNPKYLQRYSGITISASWKRINRGLIRGDLLSRLTAHVIEVPGINERKEDLPALIGGLKQTVIEGHASRIDELCKADPDVDRAYWLDQKTRCHDLTATELDKLVAVDWSKHGHLRGLTQALEAIIVGLKPLAQVLNSLTVVETTTARASHGPGHQGLLGRLMSREADGTGLASHVRSLELEQRRHLREILSEDTDTRTDLARQLGIHEDKLPHQAQEIDRSRRTKRVRKSK